MAGAPRNPHEGRELLAGMLLGLLCAMATLLIVLFASGAIALPRSNLPPLVPEVSDSEVRPTPQWPFREEWLTPRPKN